MGNIVPRAGIKPTGLAFWASVLPIHQLGSLKSPLYPRHLSMQLVASELSADYYTKVNILATSVYSISENNKSSKPSDFTTSMNALVSKLEMQASTLLLKVAIFSLLFASAGDQSHDLLPPTRKAHHLTISPWHPGCGLFFPGETK